MERERRADADSTASLWCHPLKAALCIADDQLRRGSPLAYNKAAAARRPFVDPTLSYSSLFFIFLFFLFFLPFFFPGPCSHLHPTRTSPFLPAPLLLPSPGLVWVCVCVCVWRPKKQKECSTLRSECL